MRTEEKLMRDILVEFLREKIKKDKRVVTIDADLGKCSGFISLQKDFPRRSFNVGVAEQNMASVAAGLSAYGFIPFIHSFGTFASRRMCDQVMISICYARQNVKIVGTDPGISAELNGGTHMPFEDIGVLRSMPGLVIYEPTDNIELKEALPQILKHEGPVYIRMFRKIPARVHKPDYKFNLFKADVLKKGKDVTLFASGLMASKAVDAAERLWKENIDAEVVLCHTIKPLDQETVIKSAKKTGCAVTCENHNVIGGLRSAVAETLSEHCPVPVKPVGVNDEFGEVGKLPYLAKRFGLETEDIIRAAKEAVAAKTGVKK